jgi:hypothetical protein
MRFIEKESKPLKILIRDALLVYFSVVSGYFIVGYRPSAGIALAFGGHRLGKRSCYARTSHERLRF